MSIQNRFKRTVLSLMMLTFSVAFITSCGGSGKDNNTDISQQDETEMSEQRSISQKENDMNQEQSFKTTLEGSNEVPEVESEAAGSVTVTLSGDSIKVQGDFSGLGSKYVASHIHKAAKGKNGKPIQPLDPELGSDKISGSFDSTYALSQGLIDALKSDSLYVNVHSADHKSGELRGQLSESGM